MEHTFNKILYEDKGLTKKLVLNRPDKRNSLDDEMINELTTAVNFLSEDDKTKTIVISGAGGNFCSGLFLDYLNKIQDFDVLQNKKDSSAYKNLLLSIYGCNKPTIAMVDGYALAGGCGIASACDLIVASDKSQFGYTEVRIGFIPAIVMIFSVEESQRNTCKRFIADIKIYKRNRST